MALDKEIKQMVTHVGNLQPVVYRLWETDIKDENKIDLGVDFSIIHKLFNIDV